MTESNLEAQAALYNSTKTFPARTKLKVTKRYQEACRSRKPIPFLQKRATQLGRTKEEKQNFVCIATQQASLSHCPKTWLVDNVEDFHTLLNEVLPLPSSQPPTTQNPPQVKARTSGNSITSYDLWQFMVNSNDPKI